MSFLLMNSKYNERKSKQGKFMLVMIRNSDNDTSTQKWCCWLKEGREEAEPLWRLPISIVVVKSYERMKKND